MKKIKHKISRINNSYQVQKMFNNGINVVWVTKTKGYPDKPTTAVTYRFLNEAIKDIRAEEPDGKKSEIIVDPEALKYLQTINFTKENLEILLENKEIEADAPTAIS